jgi:hypothetical protein
VAITTFFSQLEIILNLLYPCAPRKQSTILLAQKIEEKNMKTPLDSILGTIISGLILTVILYFFAANFLIKSVV